MLIWETRRGPSHRRFGGLLGIREPGVVVARDSWEVILPSSGQLRNGSDAPGRQQVYDAAGADLGWAEVDGMLAAVSKMPVAIAALYGHDDRAAAAKAVEIG